MNYLHRIVISVLFLTLISSFCFAEVYVNRLWNEAFQEYRVTTLYLEGEGLTLDRDYQNAYGLENDMDPGPPFIFESHVRIVNLVDDSGIVTDWGSLTIETGNFDPTKPFVLQFIPDETGGLFDNYWLIDGPVTVTGASWDPVIFQGAYNIYIGGPVQLGENFENSFDVSFYNCSFRSNNNQNLFNNLFTINNGHTSFEYCDFTGINNDQIFGFMYVADIPSPSREQFWDFTMIGCDFNGVTDGYSKFIDLTHLNNVTIEDNHFTGVSLSETNQTSLIEIGNCNVKSIRNNTGNNNSVTSFFMHDTRIPGPATIKTNDELPLVTHTIEVLEDASLTIENGSVLKFYGICNLHVDGDLTIDGAILTSWEDDSYGGDTDLKPPPAFTPYWGGGNGAIFIDSTGSLNMNNSTIRYASWATTVWGDVVMDSARYIDNQYCALKLEPRFTRAYTVTNSSFSRTLEQSGYTGKGILINNQFADNASYNFDGVTSTQNNEEGFRFGTMMDVPSEVIIKNCNFSGNGGYGIYAGMDAGVTKFDVANTYLCANGKSGIETVNNNDKNAVMNFESNVIAGNGFRAANRSGVVLNGIQKADIINNTIAYNWDYGLISGFDSQEDAVAINNIFYRNGNYGYHKWLATEPYFAYNWFWGNNDGTSELRYKDTSGTFIYTIEDMQVLGSHYATNQHEDPGFILELFGEIEFIRYDTASDLTIIYSSGVVNGKNLNKRLIQADTSTANWYMIAASPVDSIWILGNATEVAEVGDTLRLFDYHLLGNSNLIDAGRITEVTALNDIDGDARIIDGDENMLAAVDIGADEYDPDAGQPVAINVLGPPADTLLIAGKKYTIKYEIDDGISQIDIFSNVQYDPANPEIGWYQVAASVDPISGEYEWTVPVELSTKCRIKITNTSDANVFGLSSGFKIKYHVLTRLDGDGNFDEYTDPDDEWQFGNTEENMWPSSAYITYAADIDPYTGMQYPYQFTDPPITAVGWNFPSWVNWVEAFSVDSCYFDTWTGLIYKPSVLRKWAAIKKEWFGSCFGFAITNLMAFQDETAFEARQGIGLFTNLHDLVISDERRDLINVYWTHQWGKANLQHSLDNKNNTPKETLKELFEMMETAEVSLDDRVITVCDTSSVNNKGCHTINPYELIKTGDHTWDVVVYDNSYPNDFPVIEVDTLNNTWEYFQFNWSGKKEFYLEDPLSNYLDNAILQVKDENSQELLATAGYIEIYTSEELKIDIANQDYSIGFNGDTIYNDVPNGMHIIPKVGFPIRPTGFYLPTDDWNCLIEGASDDPTWVRVFDDNAVLTYMNFDSLVHSIEGLRYDGDNSRMWIFNPDGGGKNYNLESIAIVPDTEFVYEVKGLMIISGDSTGFSIVNQTGLKIENFGVSDTYNLSLGLAGQYLEDDFEFENITLPSNGSHQILPDIDDLINSQIKILIDNNNDGIVDDSMYVDEVSSGISHEEPGTLPTKNSLGQNFPNPFNPATTIEFAIKERSDVEISIFNLLGQKVRMLVNENKMPGTYEVIWNGCDDSGLTLPSGIYLYKIEAGNFIKTKKMILVK